MGERVPQPKAGRGGGGACRRDWGGVCKEEHRGSAPLPGESCQATEVRGRSCRLCIEASAQKLGWKVEGDEIRWELNRGSEGRRRVIFYDRADLS